PAGQRLGCYLCRCARAAGRSASRRPRRLPQAHECWRRADRSAAHPKLPEHKQAAIARDYGMTNGILVLPMRIALSYYAIRTFNLDLDLDEIPPERKQ